mgnify:CR=1 FL=1
MHKQPTVHKPRLLREDIEAIERGLIEADAVEIKVIKGEISIIGIRRRKLKREKVPSGVGQKQLGKED